MRGNTSPKVEFVIVILFSANHIANAGEDYHFITKLMQEKYNKFSFINSKKFTIEDASNYLSLLLQERNGRKYNYELIGIWGIYQEGNRAVLYFRYKEIMLDLRTGIIRRTSIKDEHVTIVRLSSGYWFNPDRTHYVAKLKNDYRSHLE